MYAIVIIGGKQYKVSPGNIIEVEKLDIEDGQTVTFDKVLMINKEDSCNIGTPYVENAKVEGKAIEQGRGKKIDVIKFIRRKRHLRKQGHRQLFTKVEITNIV